MFHSPLSHLIYEGVCYRVNALCKVGAQSFGFDSSLIIPSESCCFLLGEDAAVPNIFGPNPWLRLARGCGPAEGRWQGYYPAVGQPPATSGRPACRTPGHPVAWACHLPLGTGPLALGPPTGFPVLGFASSFHNERH